MSAHQMFALLKSRVWESLVTAHFQSTSGKGIRTVERVKKLQGLEVEPKE